VSRSKRELWFAFFVIILISLIYLFKVVVLGGVPASSELFGHSLGISGFVLMMMTETLYTLRKRSRSARWGRISLWLQFHIFTGLVGPYMVLLHTSWKFNGLAGMLTLMTLIVVGSGFIGRYIYTAIPRTADGIEMEAGEIKLLRQRATLAQARRTLALWHALHVPLGLALFTAAFIHIGAAIYYATLLR
jgi:hypothetical protein